MSRFVLHLDASAGELVAPQLNAFRLFYKRSASILLGMIEVMVSPSQVRLELTGLDILWSLKRHLTFPVAGIRSVYADPKPKMRPRGLRLPGTSIPGIVQAGTYLGETREFWCIHFMGRSVVFELEDLPYDRIIVDVRDPEAVVQRVRAVRYGVETNG